MFEYFVEPTQELIDEVAAYKRGSEPFFKGVCWMAYRTAEGKIDLVDKTLALLDEAIGEACKLPGLSNRARWSVSLRMAKAAVLFLCDVNKDEAIGIWKMVARTKEYVMNPSHVVNAMNSHLFLMMCAVGDSREVENIWARAQESFKMCIATQDYFSGDTSKGHELMAAAKAMMACMIIRSISGTMKRDAADSQQGNLDYLMKHVTTHPASEIVSRLAEGKQCFQQP